MVGDHRQLGAVRPGGGFEALVHRYGDAVHVLADNVRQRDAAERAALVELRDGNVAKAVAIYARRAQIEVARDRDEALTKLVDAWAADVAKEPSVAMYAYRRLNVAELNRRARDAWRSMGRLGDSELEAPGGARYAMGDRVVTLAPGAQTVASETGTVVGVNTLDGYLLVRMDDGKEIVRFEGEELSASRLAWGYAVTVHRSQGATVERAHALEDGGGRELAYVKMSRAKARTTVYVVADSIEQAKDDLRREWSTDRRLAWVIDTNTPTTRPLSAESSPRVPVQMRDALRRGRLIAERDAILAVIPPDSSAHIRAAELRRSRLDDERDDLAKGEGRYRDHPVGEALRHAQRAQSDIIRLQRNLANPKAIRSARRGWRSDLVAARSRHASATRALSAATGPEHARLDSEYRQVESQLVGLRRQQTTYRAWATRHPEAEHRLDLITTEIERLGGDPAERVNELAQARALRPERWLQPRTPVVDRGLSLGR